MNKAPLYNSAQDKHYSHDQIISALSAAGFTYADALIETVNYDTVMVNGLLDKCFSELNVSHKFTFDEQCTLFDNISALTQGQVILNGGRKKIALKRLFGFVAQDISLLDDPALLTCFDTIYHIKRGNDANGLGGGKILSSICQSFKGKKMSAEDEQSIYEFVLALLKAYPTVDNCDPKANLRQAVFAGQFAVATAIIDHLNINVLDNNFWLSHKQVNDPFNIIGRVEHYCFLKTETPNHNKDNQESLGSFIL